MGFCPDTVSNVSLRASRLAMRRCRSLSRDVMSDLSIFVGDAANVLVVLTAPR